MYLEDEKLMTSGCQHCAECGRSKRAGQTSQMLENYSRYARRRLARPLLVALCLAFILWQWAPFRSPVINRSSFVPPPQITRAPEVDLIDDGLDAYNASETKLHFLISAKSVDIDLCKTILTSAILTYPSPTILAKDDSNLTTVSRFPKISRVLSYVSSLDATHAEDLVLIVDGHNVHFQLPLEVLLSRYYTITRAATEAARIDVDGSSKESIAQTVVFGADKRCASAAAKEALCDATPPSPVADTLYGELTDTALSYNDWFHYRQKYVDSGFILGPVTAIRALFERAGQVAADTEKKSSLAGTSEQAVFASIFSEQERWRESRRFGHSGGSRRWLPAQETTQPLDANKNYEFGMLVDHLSEFSHSTMNSDLGRDTQFLIWNDDDSTTFHEQANNKHRRDGKLDCPIDVPSSLPADLRSMSPPHYLLMAEDNRKGSTYDHAADAEDVYNGLQWADVPLYTHLCFGTVPVMIHHSGDKQARNQSWDELWLAKRTNALFQAQREFMEEEGSGAVDVDEWVDFKENPGIKVPGGAWDENRRWQEWGDICPHEKYGKTLFHRKT